MSRASSPELSDSELLEGLEEKFDMGAERERRMQALRNEAQRLKALNETEYGKVITYGDEKKLIERMSKDKFVITHFFHPDFPRCRIMDARLEELAPKHQHTLFLRASVADTPFLVNKLGIQVLPCVYVFVDGKGVDRLIGFEDLGQTDTFTSKVLEFRLQQTGALPSGPMSLASVVGKLKADDDSDSDDDDAFRDKSRRKGKIGIRNGLTSFSADDDE